MSERQSSLARGTGRPAGDAGETLIELLVSIVIMGLSGAAIVGALMVAVGASQLHQRQVQVQQYLRSWAEMVSNATDGAYSPCADTGHYQGLPKPAAVGGISASVTNVDYWDGAAFVGSCGGGSGVQRVTLRVEASGLAFGGVTKSLDVVVRQPCLQASSC